MSLDKRHIKFRYAKGDSGSKWKGEAAEVVDRVVDVPVIPPPAGEQSLRHHMRRDHGIPQWQVDDIDTRHLVSIHEAEHRNRVSKDHGLKFIGHRHDEMDAMEKASPDHAQDIKAARAGTLSEDKIARALTRAEYVADRRQAGQVLSPFDREQAEIAAELAKRAARRARRAS